MTKCALVAQPAEQWFCKPKVGGSNPSGGTIFFADSPVINGRVQRFSQLPLALRDLKRSTGAFHRYKRPSLKSGWGHQKTAIAQAVQISRAAPEEQRLQGADAGKRDSNADQGRSLQGAQYL